MMAIIRTLLYALTAFAMFSIALRGIYGVPTNSQPANVAGAWGDMELEKRTLLEDGEALPYALEVEYAELGGLEDLEAQKGFNKALRSAIDTLVTDFKLKAEKIARFESEPKSSLYLKANIIYSGRELVSLELTGNEYFPGDEGPKEKRMPFVYSLKERKEVNSANN